VGILESGGAPEEIDAMPIDVLVDQVQLVLGDEVSAVEEVAYRDTLGEAPLHPVETPLGQPREVEGGLPPKGRRLNRAYRRTAPTLRMSRIPGART
jgi:hypothetical protein